MVREHALEPVRRVHEERARLSRAVNREGVRNVPRHEHKAAGPSRQRLVADVRGELTVEDVDELRLSGVDVHRRLRARLERAVDEAEAAC